LLAASVHPRVEMICQLKVSSMKRNRVIIT
jgi:hypothetical protein